MDRGEKFTYRVKVGEGKTKIKKELI